MIELFKNKRGETIAETIIAVSILAVGITLSATLMATSLKNMNVSKNRVIAVNIAREGLEAVRNIRDSNWLKFSGRRRLCWNNMPAESATDNCTIGSDKIKPEDYIVYKTDEHRWRLKEILTTDSFAEQELYIIDIDASIDTDRDGDDENDADMYNNRPTEDHTSVNNDAIGIWGKAVDSPFSRTITISYLANDSTPLVAPSAVTEEYNRMVVTSLVEWTRGGIYRKVELKTHLTDYLGRDNLGG